MVYRQGGPPLARPMSPAWWPGDAYRSAQ
jgi:hypothetical protein